MILDIFEYSFMVRALMAGLIIAITAPLLGVFIVSRGMSLIGDSLAHVGLAGVGLGLLLGVTPIMFAVPVAVLGAVCLEWLRQNRKINSDVSLAVLMSGGLSFALIFANLATGPRADFNSFLFGSISTVTTTDLLTLLAVSIVTVIFIALNYRSLLYIAFDEDGARISGYKVSALNYGLTVLTAVAIVASLQIVGGLLVSAIIVMPIVIGSRLSNSFFKTIIWAILVAVLAIVIGLILSFYVGIPAGGAIVITALTLLILSMIWKQ